jgi:hypothetical protein
MCSPNAKTITALAIFPFSKEMCNITSATCALPKKHQQVCELTKTSADLIYVCDLNHHIVL